MSDKLIKDEWRGGLSVCVSCYLWNCWHAADQPCDIYGCRCKGRGGNDRAGVRNPLPALPASAR
jgi:hypothetical protein